MEKLRTQQEQSLRTLGTKKDAMKERRTQAIMNSLDGLLGSRSGPREGEPNSRGPSREPRVNFNDQQNRRRTYGSTTGDKRTWGQNFRGSSTGNIQTSRNDQRKARMRLGEVIPGTGVMQAQG